MRVKVSRSLEEVDPAEWEEIFPSKLQGYRFYKTVEETLSDQFKFYYFSLYEGSRILCLAPCFLMDYSLGTTATGTLKKFTVWVQGRRPRFLISRFLICGSPGEAGNLGLDTSTSPEVMNLLVGEMRSIAEKEGARLLAFKDFPERYTRRLSPLLKMGFRRILSYPTVELDLPWKSFDEYLASLSRATRKDLKRKFKKIGNEPTILMEVKNEAGEFLEDIYRLYLNTFERSQVKFEKVTREFFKAISKNMPKETRYFLWRIEGKLVAFDLCLVSEDRLIDEYLGLDYESAYRYHLYFVTFRDIFNWCLRNGIRHYESSALDYEPKKRLDLRFVPQYFYFKHTHPLGNLFFGLLGKILKPENFDPFLKSMKRTCVP